MILWNANQAQRLLQILGSEVAMPEEVQKVVFFHRVT